MYNYIHIYHIYLWKKSSASIHNNKFYLNVYILQTKQKLKYLSNKKLYKCKFNLNVNMNI